MKQLKCPICDSVNIVFLRNYISFWNSKEYKLYHCKNCDLQWWEPLKIIPEFYEEEGVEYLEKFHKGYRTEIAPVHKPFLKYFPKKKKNNKGLLLDVGCGDGIFLKKAQELGFEVWGIDFDKKSVKMARKRYGLKNVYPMSLDEFVEFAEEKKLKFDVVTFFEVLEHQDNPKVFLKNIKRLLKPSGYIAGSVPNRDRPLVNLDRKYVNTADFPPHHFLYFNKEVLKYILKRFGFEEIYIFPVPVNFNFVNTFTESLLSMGLSKKINEVVKKFLFGNKNISVSAYEHMYNESSKVKIIKSLKLFRDITRTFILSPITIPLYFIINSKGLQIYFQAKLRNKEEKHV